MKNELKKEFTERIVNANRSDLVVIKFEMIFAYMDDARQDMHQDLWEKVKMDLSCVERILERLEKDLDFTYEISGELYRLYRYCLEQIALCRVKKNLEGMEEANLVLQKLYTSFVAIAKEDDSKPLMATSQQLVTGMTYGKNSLNETYSNDLNKGIFI